MKAFIGALRGYVKRGILSPSFFVGVIICWVLMVFFVYLDYINDTPNVGLYYFLQGVDASGGVELLLMIAVFPAGQLFYRDYISGFFKLGYIRLGRRKYIFSVILGAMITGAAAIILAYVFFSVFIVTKYPLVPDIDPEELRLAVIGFPNSGLLLRGNGLWCYLLFVLTRGAMGGFFAVLALLQSMVITNKYLTAISPVFIYNVIFGLLGDLRLSSFIDPTVLFTSSLRLFLDFGGDINGELFSAAAAFYPMLYSIVMTAVFALLGIKILRVKLNRQL